MLGFCRLTWWSVLVEDLSAWNIVHLDLSLLIVGLLFFFCCMIGDEMREGLFLDAGWCGDEMFSSPSWFLEITAEGAMG